MKQAFKNNYAIEASIYFSSNISHFKRNVKYSYILFLIRGF